MSVYPQKVIGNTPLQSDVSHLFSIAGEKGDILH